MPETRDVAVFVGSLRRASSTRRVAIALGRQLPEIYLGGVANIVDEHGNITNDGTREFLTKFMNTSAQWIEVQRCEP
jgi:NAD(P)H-dependent FMN reductase